MRDVDHSGLELEQRGAVNERSYHELVTELSAQHRVVRMQDAHFPEAALVISDRKWRRRVYLVVARNRHRLAVLQTIIHYVAADRIRNERQFYIKFNNGSEVRFVSSLEQTKGVHPETIICEP